MEFIIILVAALCLVLGQEVLYQRKWHKNLTAALEFGQEILTEGEKGSIKEIVRNEKFLPIPALHVKWKVSRNLRFDARENTAMTDQTYRNDIFSLMPYQQITRTLTFTALKRGCYEGNQIELVSHDLFFSTSYSRQIPCRARMYVYPAPVETGRLNLIFDTLLGAYRARKRLYEDPFALRGMREYQASDPFNRINWKATARAGEMMVNEYEYAASRNTVLLLNLEPDGIWPRQELQEESIRLCAALAERLSEDEIPGMVVDAGGLSDETSPEWKFSFGPAYIRRTMEYLCRLDPAAPQPRFESVLETWQDCMEENGYPFFVLISTNQSRELQRAYEDLARISPGSLWIAPLYAEDSLELPDCPAAEPIRWNVEKG